MLNHLVEAHLCAYLTAEELAELEHTARRAIKAASGLIRYLEETPNLE